MRLKHSTTWKAGTPETVLAYIAGIVDGEGCITARKQHKSVGYTTEAAGMGVSVFVVSTDKNLIDFLVSYFPAYVGIKRETRRKCRQAFAFHVSSMLGVGRFLEPLLPYLLVKKEQALLAIEIAKTTRPNTGRRPMNEKHAQIRTRAWNILRQANKPPSLTFV